MEMINKILENDLFFSLSVISVTLALSVFIYFLILFLIKRLRNVVFFSKFKIPPVCLKAPLRSLIPAACFLFMVPMLRLEADIRGFLSNAFSLWFIASAGWFLIRIVHTARESFLNLYDIQYNMAPQK